MSRPSSPARLRGLVLIGLAAVAWGTTGAVTSLLALDARASPLLVGAARLWLGAGVLALGAFLGVWLFGERLEAAGGAGAILLFGALALLASDRPSPPVAPRSP